LVIGGVIMMYCDLSLTSPHVITFAESMMHFALSLFHDQIVAVLASVLPLRQGTAPPELEATLLILVDLLH
jgi:hypothetical protein